MKTSRDTPSAQVFYYHAVVERPLLVPDPCFIDARLLRRHLQLIRERFEVMPLAELLTSRRSLRTPAAITFDDGFLNNFTVALPILRELDLPATVFLCTDLVDTDRSIWFCDVNRAIAETNLTTIRWRGDTFDLSSCTSRSEASLRMQEALKRGSPTKLQSDVDELVVDLGGVPRQPFDLDSPYRMLNGKAIHEMLASGLVEFGAHTRTHAILARLSPDEQEDEIRGSIEAVSRFTGQRCRLFSYPNGTRDDYDASTLAIVQDAGIELAVTAIRGTNDAATNPLELRRNVFTESDSPSERRRTDSDDTGHRKRVLFAYRWMGLGGVETATLAKLDALEAIGVDAWAYFHRPYGEGGMSLSSHPRVMFGLEDQETLAALLCQAWDAIVVIDFPELLDILDTLSGRPPVLYETHTAHPWLQDQTFPRLVDPIIEAIIVPSSVHADRLRQLAPEAPPIEVIANTVDAERFDPFGPMVSLPALCLRPLEKPLLWIGRLEDAKNPSELLMVGQALLERGIALRILMVGDDPSDYAGTVERVLAEASAELRRSIEPIRRVPHEQMPSLYRWVAANGGALLSTSRLETQPMTFLEAMAAKCPVVSSDVGGVGEVIKDGSTGRLYSLGDVDGAAQAIAGIMTDRRATESMTTNARALVLERHSVSALADRYRQLLDGLSGTSEGRRRTSPDNGWPESGRVTGLVSVIIPVFNRPSLVREAVASVQAQTYTSVEVILVDDGSKPDTAELCDALATDDPSIRVLHIEHVGRAGLVREAGRRAARGEFIQYLDSDDLLAPRKLEVMVRALREHPEADIAYAKVRRYAIGQERSDIPAERSGEAHTAMLPDFLTSSFWQTSCPLYRRDISDLAGPWTDLPVWEDYEYDMRMAGLGARLIHCPEFLVDFRDHSDDRLSRPQWFNDPDLLPEAIRAHAMLHAHARRGGMSEQDEAMRDLLAAVRFIWANCHRLGLADDEADALALMKEIAGAKPDLAEPTLRAQIEPLASVLVLDPGATAQLQVRVINQSSITFRNHVLQPGLSYHVLDDSGTVVQWDGPRVWFSSPLRPGGEQIVTIPVAAPEKRGRYRLELDLVMESVTWFKDAGSPTADVILLVGSEPVIGDEPLVSVVIPAFNQAAYLPEAVESVRWQTYENWECIIVDDGSTDETAVVGNALAAQDGRVRYYHQANHGLSAARNAGLAVATGKYVQFLDADDAIAPSKLRRQVAIMESAPSVGVTYSNFWRFDGRTGRPIDRTDLRLGARPLEDFLFSWERGLTIPIHAALFRRALWAEVAPFDQRLHGREDWLMWVDLALRDTEMVFVDADLAWYRIHDRNMVRDQSEMLRLLIQAAQLIGPRLPPQYQRLFVDETVRYITQSARALLGNDAPAEARPLHGAVEGLEMLAHQLRRAGVAADAGADVIDELRIVAVACRRQGFEADAERCDAAAQMAAGADRPLEPARLTVNLKPAYEELAASGSEAVGLPVLVRNLSNVALREGTYTKFALSYHLRKEDGTAVAWDNARVMFDQTLGPGEERLFSLTIAAPAESGRYVIEIDVVCEGVTWLADLGSQTAVVALTVSKSPTATSVSAAAAKKPTAQAADGAQRLSRAPGGGVAH